MFHLFKAPPTPTAVAGAGRTNGIAARFGTTVNAIYQSNRTTIGSNPNLIYPGQKLYIPD
jgi:nucleoid-associated protein YgaU